MLRSLLLGLEADMSSVLRSALFCCRVQGIITCYRRDMVFCKWRRLHISSMYGNMMTTAPLSQHSGAQVDVERDNPE